MLRNQAWDAIESFLQLIVICNVFELAFHFRTELQNL